MKTDKPIPFALMGLCSRRRMALRLRVTACLVLALLAYGCDRATPPRGASNEVPMRIVSLAPSITEILFSLGLGDRVVGNTTYCDYPPAADALPKVGGLLDPNIEAILGLKPDVVILLRTNEDAQLQLQAMGIPSRVVAGATVEQVLQSIEDIGETCGCAARGLELSQRLRRRLRRVETAVNQRPRPSVLISIGRTLGQGALKDVYIAGEDGYFSELIRLAGGRNACNERSISFPLVSQEGILQMAPEVIIELASDLERSGYAKADIVREWRTLEYVPAVKNGRIHVFTEDYVTVPGPRFVDLLDHMAMVLHPDLVLPPLESPQ